MKRIYIVTVAPFLFMVLGNFTTAKAQRLGFAQADSLIEAHSQDLQSARWNVTAAEGQLSQSCRYDNPTVNVMYNVRNPNNRRWLDSGYDGEVDVQVSQPFAIGGQHAEQVRQNKALLQASQSQLQVTHRDLRTQVHTMMIDLYYQQRQAEAYDVEIASLEKILAVYREQSAKGNISKIETQRIAAMAYQLGKSRADLMVAASALQSQLRLILAIKGTEPLEIVLDEAKALTEASHIYLSLRGGAAMSQVDALPELQLLTHQANAARHALKWQRSQALPQMALQGEYDKNGNIGHNYFALGLSVALPLWNHNRGNIRSAEAAMQQANIAADRQRLALAQQRQADLDIVEQYFKQLEPSSSFESDLNSMLHSTERQFLNRHITLVEFVDLYANYRDTMLARFDAKNKVLQAAEHLKIIWGK